MKKILLFIATISLSLLGITVMARENIGFSSLIGLRELANLEELITVTLGSNNYTLTLMDGFEETDKYILVEDIEMGYLIYDRSLQEYVEYSEFDVSPYNISEGQKLYAAPTYYFDVTCDGTLSIYDDIMISDEETQIYSSLETKLSEQYYGIKYQQSTSQSGTQSLLAATIDPVHIPYSYYFSNLRNNMGVNNGLYSGSCGYVAICMIYAYYDTFFKDLIIPETQEEKGETFSPTDFSTCTDSPGHNIFFQDAVMNYAAVKGYKTPGSNALNITRLQSIITGYMTEEVGLTTTRTRTDTLAKCKTAISSGYPVIIGIDGWHPSEGQISHFVVGYAYDSIGIIANFGWMGNDRQTHINGYTIGDGLYIDISGNPTYTDNYYYVEDDDYCRRYIDVRTGYSTQHPGYTYNNLNGTYHTRNCTACAYSEQIVHLYKYNNALQLYVCACGASRRENPLD